MSTRSRNCLSFDVLEIDEGAINLIGAGYCVRARAVGEEFGTEDCRRDEVNEGDTRRHQCGGAPVIGKNGKLDHDVGCSCIFSLRLSRATSSPDFSSSITVSLTRCLALGQGVGMTEEGLERNSGHPRRYWVATRHKASGSKTGNATEL